MTFVGGICISSTQKSGDTVFLHFIVAGFGQSAGHWFPTRKATPNPSLILSLPAPNKLSKSHPGPGPTNTCSGVQGLPARISSLSCGSWSARSPGQPRSQANGTPELSQNHGICLLCSIDSRHGRTFTNQSPRSPRLEYSRALESKSDGEKLPRPRLADSQRTSSAHVFPDEVQRALSLHGVSAAFQNCVQ